MEKIVLFAVAIVMLVITIVPVVKTCSEYIREEEEDEGDEW